MCAKALVLLFGVILFTTGLAQAQNVSSPQQGLFRVQWEAARGGVTGWVYNDEIYSATNVRLRIEVLDASGRVIGERSAWVVGDVPARGRAFFAVPVQIRGATYRVSVEAFARLPQQSP